MPFGIVWAGMVWAGIMWVGLQTQRPHSLERLFCVHRTPLLLALLAYQEWMPQEATMAERLARFVQSTPECFERTYAPGHVTGSALVVNPGFDRVLLTHHRKLDIWVQLGGHADGEARVERVAWTEAVEESGLSDFGLFVMENGTAELRNLASSPFTAEEPMPTPFDLDIHLIPARKSEPEHYHYDVRYLLVADDRLPLVVSAESHDLRWLSLAEARQLTQEASMVRMFDKVEALRTAGRMGAPSHF